MFDLAISTFDLAIVLVYMLFAVLLGLWVSGRQENVDDYFLGDRSLPWWALLLSIVATETSTVTFLSVPGVAFDHVEVARIEEAVHIAQASGQDPVAAGREAAGKRQSLLIGHTIEVAMQNGLDPIAAVKQLAVQRNGDFRFLQVAIGYILGRTLVSLLLLPAYFRGKLFTSYEVLQQRFGAASRRLASLLFMLTRTLADALRLFLTAIVLREVIQLVLKTCVVIIGFATIAYTFFGGMRSVVWNDCIQFVVYMVGAVWALVVLMGKLPAGWDSIVEYGVVEDKFRMFDFSFDPRSPTYTFWIGLVGGAFLTLATHGTDQLTVQRLLSARRQREASWALIGSGFVVAAQFALFLLIGVGLACFYRTSVEAREFSSTDQVFATFIVEQLPRGVVGITLAAVFSAAMSTLSSSLNASANAAVSDFIRPLSGTEISERRLLMAGRLVTIMFGLAQIAIAIVAERILGERAAVYKVLNIAGFTTGPILGLFFLAACKRPVSQVAALIGFVAGVAALTYVAFWLPEAYKVNGFYYSFIGSTTTFLVGLLSQRLLGRT